jgi:hypothetical protein
MTALLRSVDEGREAPDGLGAISWADSNPAAFARLLHLYARPGMRIADVTYGHGVFWKDTDPTQYELLATDLVADGIDARNLPYPDGHLHGLVFDPPYRYVETRTTRKASLDRPYNLEAVRGKGMDAVMDLYRDGITEAGRVLARGGYAFIKCQDTAGDGRQRWVHIEVMQMLEAAGMTVVDLMLVVTANPPPTRWKKQRSLKKAHSYFVVARKGGYYPFGYKSVQAR